MMLLLELLVVLVVLAIIGAAAIYIIQKFAIPDPVKIIVGCILLLVLLFYAVALFNNGRPFFIVQAGPAVVVR